MLTLILTVALLLSTITLLTQAIGLTTEPIRDARSVISEELLHILECRELQRFRTANNMATVELPMEDTLPISVWLTGIDEDAVEAAALEETGLNKERIRELSSEGVILESEEVDAYIEAERRIYSERQRAANESFVASKATTVATFSSEASNSESDRFISSYAPMVVTDATDEEIWSLAEDSAVESIIYEPDMEIELASTITTGQGETRANYVRDTLGYTGKGVKIGQIESALPKLDTLPSGQVILNGSNPSNAGDYTLLCIDHATAVAEIMISIGNRTTGSATRGIAPDASLYCTVSETTGELYSGIEWLLKRGVNVINMSAIIRYESDTGTPAYDAQPETRWIEHLAIMHSVHFVISAGNKNNASGLQVGSPSSAYNVITVGNLDTSSGSVESGHILYSSSNYIDDPNHANKPDLVAPGTSICTSSFLTAKLPTHGDYLECSITGTSFAAPIVTGIVAQILEQNPGLKTQQDTVKAILTCAINHSKIRYTSDSTEFEKYGAGCVDARGSGYVARVHQYKGDHFEGNASAGSTKEYTFTVKSTDDLKRIALTWLKRTTITSHTTTSPIYSEGNVAKLRLEIFGPNGNSVANAVPSTGGNLVIIQLDNPAAGTYKIRVTLETPSDQRVNFAVAWW